jgi:beta-glucosidase
VAGPRRVGHTCPADASWRPDGLDVPQLYLTEAAGDQRMRLLGFERVGFRSGESRHVVVTADPAGHLRRYRRPVAHR